MLEQQYSTCDHVLWWFEDLGQVTDWHNPPGCARGITPVSDLPLIFQITKIHGHTVNIPSAIIEIPPYCVSYTDENKYL